MRKLSVSDWGPDFPQEVFFCATRARPLLQVGQRKVPQLYTRHQTFGVPPAPPPLYRSKVRPDCRRAHRPAADPAGALTGRRAWAAPIGSAPSPAVGGWSHASFQLVTEQAPAEEAEVAPSSPEKKPAKEPEDMGWLVHTDAGFDRLYQISTGATTGHARHQVRVRCAAIAPSDGVCVPGNRSICISRSYALCPPCLPPPPHSRLVFRWGFGYPLPPRILRTGS